MQNVSSTLCNYIVKFNIIFNEYLIWWNLRVKKIFEFQIIKTWKQSSLTVQSAWVNYADILRLTKTEHKIYVTQIIIYQQT